MISLLFITFLSMSPWNEPFWGPWSVTERYPVLAIGAEAHKETPREQIFPSVTAPFIWAIRFFQIFVTNADGPRCMMYPTCSQYGYLAFKKHGPIVGLFMTADRLMRDNISVEEFYPIIPIHGTFRFYDPVEDNDFWWTSLP